MKIKAQTIYISVITVLILIIVYLFFFRKHEIKTETKIEKVNVPFPVSVPTRIPKDILLFRPNQFTEPLKRYPEFRGPPLKNYKPGYLQQMGLLKDDTGEILPLYGKASNTHRDRFHYYTTTGSHNLYPVPITHNGRDCVNESVGCQELFDGEKVKVFGKENEFTVTTYKNVF